MAARSLAESLPGHGTRPGLHAQTLVSTGQADLDRLLGGGLPLGCLLVILEDAFSQHHRTLLRYFVAEGLACGQHVHWASPGPKAANPTEGLPQPVEASLDKPVTSAAPPKEEAGLRIAWQYRQYLQNKQQPVEPARKSTSAFQRKTGSSGGSAAKMRDWCHSFDLTRPMKEGSAMLDRCSYAGEGACAAVLRGAEAWAQRLHDNKAAPQRAAATDLRSQVASAVDAAADPSEGNMPEAKPVRRLMTSMAGTTRAAPATPHSHQSQADSKGAARLTATEVIPKEAPQPSGAGQGSGRSPQQAPPHPGSSPNQIGRLAIESLGSWQLGLHLDSKGSSTALMQGLQRLKGLARKKRMAAMVSVPAGLYDEDLAIKLQHISDCAIVLGSISDVSDIYSLITDAKSCCGTLRVTKLPGLNTLAPPEPLASLHLIRNRRRSIALQAFEVDPDAEAGLSEGVATSGSSAASKLCGGPPKRDNDLDF